MTGASGIIGGALARRLWAQGAWAGVRFLLQGRDEGRLQALAREAREQGMRAEVLVLDLAQPEAGRVLAEAAVGLGPLAGLALVAGINHDLSLSKLEEADWDKVWKANVRAHAALIRALHRPGTLAPGARGILTGSIVGLRGNHGQAAYAAAKGALVDLLPFAPAALRLNVLLPPLVESPLLQGLSPEARVRLYSTRLFDDPDPALSCALAGEFLLSDDSSYVHRQVIHADSRVSELGWA